MNSRRKKEYYNSQDYVKTVRLSITGMHCANCVANIEKKYKDVKGIRSVSVNLVSNSATILYNSRKISVPEILQVLDGTQFSASVVNDPFEVFEKSNAQKKGNKGMQIFKMVLAIVLSAAIVAICIVPGLYTSVGDSIYVFLHETFPDIFERLLTPTLSIFSVNILLMVLTIPVQFFCGWTFISGSFRALKNKTANMDVLVFMGTIIAFAFSVYITFQPVFEDYWGAQTSRFTNGGMPFFDACAMLITFVLAGKYLENSAKNSTNKALEELVNLVPHTAHKVEGFADAADLLNGMMRGYDVRTAEIDSSQINAADLLYVAPGENVPADGVVLFGSSRVDESMLTGESDLVHKMPSSDVVGGTKNVGDKFIMQVKCPNSSSTLASIIRAVSDAQSSKAPVQRVVDSIAAVFVPVILVIALITFFAWILIVAGEPKYLVQQGILCAVSVLVVACPCALGLATPTALAVGMGKGAQLGIIIRDGVVLEQMCNVGHAVFDKTGTLTKANLDDDPRNAKILRPESQAAVRKLRDDFGVAVYMVSGDKQAEAVRVSAQVGIDPNHVVFETTPLGKKEFIIRLKQQVRGDKNNKVTFIGDGINDAPALTEADIGITLESGTNVALESGDVVLMHNDLRDVATSIKLSKATMRKIKQNLFWALGYNVVMIPLAAFGILAPAIAGGIHAVSSLIVVLNSLLLKRFDR